MHDIPIAIGRTPDYHTRSPRLSADRALNVLSEDHEAQFAVNRKDKLADLPELQLDSPPTRRAVVERTSTTNRNAIIFSPPTDITPSAQEPQSHYQLARDHRRQSIRSLAQSITPSYLENLDLALPPDHNYRDSVASFATFMTDATVDGVLPRHERRRSNSVGAERRHRQAVPEDEQLDEFDYPIEADQGWPSDDGGDDVLNNYFQAPLPQRSSEVNPIPTFEARLSISDFDTRGDTPQFERRSTATPLGRRDYPEERTRTPSPRSSGSSARDSPSPPTPPAVPAPQYLPSLFLNRTLNKRRSVISTYTTSTLDSLTSYNRSNMLTIKAALRSNIVVLRLSRDTTYDDLLAKIRQKFVYHEGISDDVKLGILHALPVQTDEETARLRREAGLLSKVSVASHTDLKLVAGQNDWEDVVENCETGKLTLRVFEQR